ncbi:MAG TPA: hypothetical protein VH206_13565 [Xanthobacteraceae bacterium]|jgi:hypothetical protein|nr:hypothetical protein [Xanthobacteraceae bacterium]
MTVRVCSRRDVFPAPAAAAALAWLALSGLSGCSSIGDYGRLDDALVTDDIHAWVGEEAAVRAGQPVSAYNLTEDERTLRDLAFPLIEAPYDRNRWDAVVFEYGTKKSFQRKLWGPTDLTAYYRQLANALMRTSAGRYNILIDDIRNDIVRVEPFFMVARKVMDLDRRRAASMAQIGTLTPAERVNAQARIGENSLTIAWVHNSLEQRCAGYRYALEHLAVAEPESLAADADRALTELQQKIAANPVIVAAIAHPVMPVAVATRQVSK